jgi:hypothetical protein
LSRRSYVYKNKRTHLITLSMYHMFKNVVSMSSSDRAAAIPIEGTASCGVLASMILDEQKRRRTLPKRSALSQLCSGFRPVVPNDVLSCWNNSRRPIADLPPSRKITCLPNKAPPHLRRPTFECLRVSQQRHGAHCCGPWTEDYTRKV